MLGARFVVLIVAGLALPFAPPARAQEVDRIAAVVNEDIISVRDLDQRIKLALVISNLADTIENRRRLLPQVLRKMIDERLQTQEADRIKSQVSGEELARAIASIEQQNRMPPGGLLSSLERAGVDPVAIRDQIRADIAWLKVVSRLLQPTIRVGEEEVTERLDTLRQQRGRPEFLLAEIVLPVDGPRQEEEARRLGERLLDQLKSGAPFHALARQFSQSGSAANGGSLGWVNEANLDDDIREPVSGLEKGQIAPLIRTATGFTIIGVVDRRIAGAAPEQDMVSLYRLFFPNPVGGAAPAPGALAAKATEMTAHATDCDAMEELGAQINSPRSGRIDNTKISTLPPETARAISGLPVGKASPPQSGPDGLTVYMLCAGTGTIGLPSRGQVRRQIEDERTEMLARRHIRDLRRAAFVDFRL